MRDKYVGDVGDYYKYGLLRHLIGHTAGDQSSRLKLGVVWYLFNDPCERNDGNHRSYLEERNSRLFRPLDPELYDAMSVFEDPSRRSVGEVDRLGILPGALTFPKPLSLSRLPRGTSDAIGDRIRYRNGWLDDAVGSTAGADIIFLDPDNGLQVPSTPFHRDAAPKYAFYSELLPFWTRGQSLVIYQHKNLHQKASAQITERQEELEVNLPGGAIRSVYFPSGSGRIFIVVAQPHHSELMLRRLDSFRRLGGDHIRSLPTS